MRVGFIGTGSMGTVLIEAFIRSGALNPEQITATNRTIGKAERLAEQYPGLHVSLSGREVATASDLIFVCVKPGEYRAVFDDIVPVVRAEQILVSITSPVLIRHLEELVPCKIAKVIPSITHYVLSGSSLCIYSDRMLPEDKELLENLLSHIGCPIRVSEQHTRISSDITSCGPAFLAYFLQRFVEAAVAMTGIPEEEAIQLISEMTLGTGKLLTTGGFTPVSLQKRVAVPGGITAEGLRIMEKELHGVFDDLIRTTHSKYDEEVEKVEARMLEAKSDG